MHQQHINTALEIAYDYLDTVEANIQLFLKDKPLKMDVNLDNIKTDFTTFWNNINARGDLHQALNEWNTTYNAS